MCKSFGFDYQIDMSHSTGGGSGIQLGLPHTPLQTFDVLSARVLSREPLTVGQLVQLEDALLAIVIMKKSDRSGTNIIPFPAPVEDDEGP